MANESCSLLPSPAPTDPSPSDDQTNVIHSPKDTISNTADEVVPIIKTTTTMCPPTTATVPPDTCIHNTLKVHLLNCKNTNQTGDTAYASIWFTSSMSCEELSQCILHAVRYSECYDDEDSLYPSRNKNKTPRTNNRKRRRWISESFKENYDNDDEDVDSLSQLTLSGLFRQRDGLFIPLSQILRYPQLTTSDTFRITTISKLDNHHTIERNITKSNIKRRWILLCLIILIVLFVQYIYYYFRIDFESISISIAIFIESIIASILRLPLQILETCIDHPLKELYRYGPAFIGWEGLSFSQICQRITHMGDEHFWIRNMDECMRIYHEKENIALQIRKPIVYLLVLYMFFVLLRSLIQVWVMTLRSRRRQDHIDPDMKETFEAFNMLLRQIRRGLKQNTAMTTIRGKRSEHED